MTPRNRTEPNGFGDRFDALSLGHKTVGLRVNGGLYAAIHRRIWGPTALVCYRTKTAGGTRTLKPQTFWNYPGATVCVTDSATAVYRRSLPAVSTTFCRCWRGSLGRCRPFPLLVFQMPGLGLSPDCGVSLLRLCMALPANHWPLKTIQRAALLTGCASCFKNGGPELNRLDSART